MMSPEQVNAEERAEAAHLKARQASDRCAAMAKDVRVELVRLAARLTHMEAELGVTSELVGVLAAKNVRRPIQKPRRTQDPEICSCDLYQGTPHNPHGKKPEEEAA